MESVRVLRAASTRSSWDCRMAFMVGVDSLVGVLRCDGICSTAQKG